MEVCFVKEYAEKFYKSKSWQKCREGYIKSVGGLCEQCLANGIIRPGVIVHHIVHIDSKNINCPEVTMNFANLELLCRDCHAVQHNKHVRRYKVDDFGVVTARE